MDIRRFFGGGAKTTKPPGNISKPAASKPPVKNTQESKKTAPKKKASTKDSPTVTEIQSSDIQIVESSDTEESLNPVKVRQRNSKLTGTTETVKQSTEKISKGKGKSPAPPKSELSPSEKENKRAGKRKSSNGAIDDDKDVKDDKKSRKKKDTSLSVASSDDEEFQSIKKSKKTKKGTIIVDSDSDEDPLPEAQREKKQRKKKTSNFVSDSDEEDKQMSITAAFNKVPKGSPKKEKTPEAKKPVQKCNVADFFGASSIHRVERKGSVKRKAEERSPKSKAAVWEEEDDMEIHDDEDFENTLLQLDMGQESKAKRPKVEAGSPPKQTGSLASKLSRLKEKEVFVKQTPDKKKSPVKSEMFVVEETPLKPGPSAHRQQSPKRRDSPKKILHSTVKTPKAEPRTSPRKSPGSANADGTPKMARGGASFRAYLQRSPPKALGSKEIPEGAPNCLEGLTFVISGVLESIERDEAKALIERYGGKVTTSLSRRTSYLVLGRDAGVSKTAKAEEMGTKTLDEDGLLNLIKTAPGKKSKYEISAETSAAKTPKRLPITKRSTPLQSSTAVRPSAATPQPSPSTSRPSPSIPSSSSAGTPVADSPRAPASDTDTTTLMWVDKYKPRSLKQVIGQQGPKSNANKLLNWLRNWHRWQAEGRKPAFNNRFSDDGAGYKAALLSGPPGVGKTTTATLVCEEMGFSYVELNASDTRSKKSLETEVAELLGNHTLVDFFGGSGTGAGPVATGVRPSSDGKQHCLIMDEVDGMSGNQDRGGMQELITLIKNSRIPIITMCNDRNHPKVRSLANYCFDLRFQRPRVEQIKSAMMSLAYKEGIKIPPPALNDVIAAANQDIRQVIHNLSMWTADDKAITHDQLKKDSAKATKDIKLGPFDVCRKVFVGGEETAKMTIHDKADLFFHDYSFGPLFVHENYIHAMPYAAKGDKKKHLACLSRAMDAIADGDLVDRRIRNSQNWSLLPLQAMFSSVIPGEMMRGGFSQMVQFPQWLGKNSTTNKTQRILQELHMHMSLKLSCDRRALNLDYVPHLRRALTQPLVRRQQEGVADVVGLVNDYDLLREDYDNLLEVSQWSHLREPLAGVEPKTKAAFTRMYNKEAHLTPYAAVVAAKKGRGRGGGGGGADLDMGLEEEEQYVDEANDEAGAESDEDVTKDAMIKPKKKTTGGKAKGESTKGKGRGKKSERGKGRGR